MQELWRQGRGNRDKFSHNVELSPAKVNEKRRFFFAGSNLFSKRSHQKTKRILKKSKTSSFFDPHSEEWPLAHFCKNQTLWLIGGWRGRFDTCFFGYLPWPGDICVEVSALEKCRKRRTVHFMWTGKKHPPTNLNDLRKLRSPKAVVFFFIGLYNLLG